MQGSQSGLKTPREEATASDAADMPNGSHMEADEETSPEEEAEREEVDEATQAKRQLLVRAAPLAGTWGLERFGLADITVLKLIEALPGALDQTPPALCRLLHPVLPRPYSALPSAAWLP